MSVSSARFPSVLDAPLFLQWSAELCRRDRIHKAGVTRLTSPRCTLGRFPLTLLLREGFRAFPISSPRADSGVAAAEMMQFPARII